jgi:hypothetical protein
MENIEYKNTNEKLYNTNGKLNNTNGKLYNTNGKNQILQRLTYHSLAVLDFIYCCKQ